MTNNFGVFDRAVMISSVKPSAKNPCLGSSLMFAKGSTAIEGLSRGGGGGLSGKGCAVFVTEAGSIFGARQ
jgi:hypothetical protein